MVTWRDLREGLMFKSMKIRLFLSIMQIWRCWSRQSQESCIPRRWSRRCYLDTLHLRLRSKYMFYIGQLQHPSFSVTSRISSYGLTVHY